MNKKSFSIINRIAKSLTLYIADFPYAVTLLFRIRDKIVLTFTPLIAMIFSSTILVKKVRLRISSVKFTEKPVATIKGGIVRLAYIIKEYLKTTWTVGILGQAFAFGMSLIQKTYTTITQKMPILATLLLATFTTLGVLDLEILGNLDGDTLGVMDYEEILP